MEFESNSLKRIKKASKNGDVHASYQLITNYKKDDHKDDAEALKLYENLFVEQLQCQRLSLKKIKLKQFKSFSEIEIPFVSEANSTILVGNNGCGKSSVLESIKYCLSHLRSRISTRSANGDQIERSEIKIGSRKANITAVFELGEKEFEMDLVQVLEAINDDIKSDYTGVNQLGSMYKTALDIDKNVSFPILASYTVDRAIDVTTKDIENSDEIKSKYIWDRPNAYYKSLSGKADFKLFFKWVKELIEREILENSDATRLKDLIASKRSELNSSLIKKLQASNPALAQSFILEYTAQIHKMTEKLNQIHDIQSKSLQTVENAIFRFLPGFNNLKLKSDPLDLTVQKDDLELSILQLSQGERSVLALVADMARRLTLLNPALKDPLKGSGIVLIDEVDLHLHPSWQQKIINRLEETFENVQFIITTHSPQVCHTVESKNIWLLKNGEKISAPKGVRGSVSSWVLKQLFEVEDRPPNDKYTIMLNDYVDLVYSDKYGTEEAVNMAKELSRHFGAEYDVLIDCKLYIENKEWEKSFEADK